MDAKEINQCLTSVLTPDAVSSKQEDIDAFSTFNPILKQGRTPTHVARPSDENELAGLVELANEKDINLTVSSSSGPHVRGGLVSEHESVMVDLSQWDKVLWINRRNRVCQIQAGVSYKQLLDALKPHGMTISMPLAPRSGKSVLAEVMDRTPSTWPNKQWDISDPVASTEFIFGNGALFRTGSAGGPGTIEEQRAVGGAQKCSLGPSQTDFHRVIQGAQGIMGIVTWITMRTELTPSVQKPFLVGADAFDKIVPFVFDVQRPWLGEHSFILNRTAAAMLLGAVGVKDYNTIHGSLPAYVCLQNIAGFTRFSKQRVKYQEKDI